MKIGARSLAKFCAVLMVLGTTVIGCPCTDSLLNSSPALQWMAFSRFGAGRVCEEMTKRGVLLKVDVPVPGVPAVIGRFYPQTCQSNTNDNARTLTVWLTGNGYAWTPVTRKMSFECEASIEYKARLQKDGGTIYVWFEPATTPPTPKFRITYVEQQPTSTVLRLPPGEWFAGALANSFISAQLGRGFTVIHESGGDDFAFGQLAFGTRPKHPYDISGSDRFQLANETTIVYGNEQDFLGPFEVDQKERALYIKMKVSGPPLDVFVVSRDVGTAWRMSFHSSARPVAPPMGGPIIKQAQTPPTGAFSGWLAVPRGSYYIVLDNSSAAGTLAPVAKIPTPFDPSLAQPSTVDYLVELGDEP